MARAGHGFVTLTKLKRRLERRTYINYMIPEIWQGDGFTVFLLLIKMLQISSVETASLFSFVEIDIFTFEFYRRYFLLKYSFPTRGDFAPRGQLAIPGDNFGCHNCRGQGCYWYLMARSQECYEHPNNAQKPPHNKNTSSPYLRSAKVEKSCAKRHKMY